MSDEMVPIGADDPFGFSCGPDVSCFNECCRDLNQFLTPYDVLRLKNALGMTSHAFLKQYTHRHNGPESGLPVVVFKMDPAADYACPFVSDIGCRVYADRPASCRMYPLARAVARSRDTGKLTEYFAVIEEPHCNGFGRVADQTVAQWLDGQDVAEHNRVNDRLLEVIALKNKLMPGPLDGADGDLFYLALYDLDTFRERIQNEGLLSDLEIPQAVLDKALSDDTALLELGMAWVRYRLFGQALKLDDLI